MKQPPLITPREVDVPRAQRHTLPNGASLYAIPSDDFEVLRFTFVSAPDRRCSTRLSQPPRRPIC